MKNKAVYIILFLSLLTVCLPTNGFSQYKMDSFQIEATSVLDDLKNMKTANPKITADELAAAGNEAIDKKGLNFVFAFDPATCQKIKEAKAKQKSANAPLNLKAQLKSVEGETANVILPSAFVENDACGRCLTTIPLLEATDKDFITIIRNRNIKFFTPPNFIADEVYLLDAKSPNTKLKTFKVPFRTQPIGISADGKILYLELPFAELNELALLIFEEGVFQLYARKDLNLSEKPIVPKDVSPSGNGSSNLISFGIGEKIRILQYRKDCK